VTVVIRALLWCPRVESLPSSLLTGRVKDKQSHP
jgi:hypothetical protein